MACEDKYDAWQQAIDALSNWNSLNGDDHIDARNDWTLWKRESCLYRLFNPGPRIRYRKLQDEYDVLDQAEVSAREAYYQCLLDPPLDGGVGTGSSVPTGGGEGVPDWIEEFPPNDGSPPDNPWPPEDWPGDWPPDDWPDNDPDDFEPPDQDYPYGPIV